MNREDIFSVIARYCYYYPYTGFILLFKLEKLLKKAATLCFTVLPSSNVVGDRRMSPAQAGET